MKQATDNLKYERVLWEKGILRVAGVDEVGRGPLAGPVVAAAVIFEPETFIEGITDSKKLSEKRREVLYQLIHEQALAIGIGVVDHRQIDQINIRQATFKAMRMAIGRLKPRPDYLLIDGEALPEKLIAQEGIVKGDFLSFSIGAASIVAKVTRDRIMVEMDEEYPQYGFAGHKGYGTAAHREAILQHGPCEIHRRSFLRKILGER